MHPEHVAKIDAAIGALIESMHKCWSHYHLLRGVHEGSKIYPKAIETHSAVLMQVWQSTFEALFTAVGTLLDKRRDTNSINTVITLVRRLGTPEIKSILPPIESQLSEKNSNLNRVREWRHNAVAHWSENGRNPLFYEQNKLSLDEVEEVLLQVERAINEISWHAISVHNTVRPASEQLVESGVSLLRSLEEAAQIGKISNGA